MFCVFSDLCWRHLTMPSWLTTHRRLPLTSGVQVRVLLYIVEIAIWQKGKRKCKDTAPVKRTGINKDTDKGRAVCLSICLCVSVFVSLNVLVFGKFTERSLQNSYTVERRRFGYWLAMKPSWQVLCFSKDSAPELTQVQWRRPATQAPGLQRLLQRRLALKGFFRGHALKEFYGGRSHSRPGILPSLICESSK